MPRAIPGRKRTPKKHRPASMSQTRGLVISPVTVSPAGSRVMSKREYRRSRRAECGNQVRVMFLALPVALNVSRQSRAVGGLPDSRNARTDFSAGFTSGGLTRLLSSNKVMLCCVQEKEHCEVASSFDLLRCILGLRRWPSGGSGARGHYTARAHLDVRICQPESSVDGRPAGALG